MVKCTTLTTSAGNLIGDNRNSITAGARGDSTTLEKVMKTIGKGSHRVRSRVFRTCFHGDARVGRQGGESLHTAAPILPLI